MIITYLAREFMKIMRNWYDFKEKGEFHGHILHKGNDRFLCLF